MKRNWIYVIVVVAVIVGFIAFKSVKANPVGNQVEGGDSLPDPGSAAMLAPGSFPIRKGDRTQLVQSLQKALNAKYGQRLSIDGDWGPATQKAIDYAMGKLLGKKVTGTQVVSQSNYNDLTQGKTNQAVTWRNNAWVNSVIDDLNDLFHKWDKSKEHQIVSLGRYGDGQLKQIHSNYQDKFFSSLTRSLDNYNRSTDSAVMAAKRKTLKNLNRLQLS